MSSRATAATEGQQIRSPAYRKQRFLAARTFYTVILVISTIAAITLINVRRDSQGDDDPNSLPVRHGDLINTVALSPRTVGFEISLRRRDEAVRYVLADLDMKDDDQ